MLRLSQWVQNYSLSLAVANSPNYFPYSENVVQSFGHQEVAFVKRQVKLFGHHVPQSHHLVPAVVLDSGVWGEQGHPEVLQTAQGTRDEGEVERGEVGPEGEEERLNVETASFGVCQFQLGNVQSIRIVHTSTTTHWKAGLEK